LQLELDTKTKPKILVVEAKSIDALDIKQRLEQLGYEVPFTVGNGRDAIRLVKQELPHIVLMDIQIQGDIDGIETASIIREEFDLPIVFLSANSDTTTIDRVKSAGPLAFLLKPFEDIEIQTTVEIALHRHKLGKELRANQTWLQTVLWSIGDAVIATDCQNQVVFMNPAAEMLTGFNADNAIGAPIKDVLKLVDENTGRQFKHPTRKQLEDNDNHQFSRNFLLIDKSENQTLIENTISSMIDTQGRLIGSVSVFHAISQLKRAEISILQQERDLKKVAEGERSKLQTIL